MSNVFLMMGIVMVQLAPQAAHFAVNGTTLSNLALISMVEPGSGRGRDGPDSSVRNTGKHPSERSVVRLACQLQVMWASPPTAGVHAGRAALVGRPK
jgi:hypothetical protein